MVHSSGSFRRSLCAIASIVAIRTWKLTRLEASQSPPAGVRDMSDTREQSECVACTSLYDSFRLWLLDHEHDLFWISGKAGSRKSTSMSYLSNGDRLPEFLVHHSIEDATVLSAYIWSSGDTMQKSTKGLMCTLLYQTFQQHQDVAAHISKSKFNQPCRTSPSDWSDIELQSIMKEMFNIIDRTTYIFIDGLDEIDQNPQKLLKVIQGIQNIAKVKICVSSRSETIYVQALQHYPHMRLQDLTRKDLSHYVHKTTSLVGGIPLG